MDSLIIDDNQSQFDFIIGLKEEIIEEPVLNGPEYNGNVIGMGEPISPPPLSFREELQPNLDEVSK